MWPRLLCNIRNKQAIQQATEVTLQFKLATVDFTHVAQHMHLNWSVVSILLAAKWRHEAASVLQPQLSGAAEARRAHNPEGNGSKPFSAMSFVFLSKSPQFFWAIVIDNYFTKGLIDIFILTSEFRVSTYM